MLGDSAISVGFGLHSRYPGHSLTTALERIKPQIDGCDVVLGNLECPLTRTGVGPSRWHRDQMRGDPEYAGVLREAGFTALNIANNHALQHGRRGFDDTVRALTAAGIACIGLRGADGWSSAPVIVQSATGLRVGMLGYCWRPRQFGTGESPYAEGSAAEALADARRLRERCDAVIISLHWGEDFVCWPSASESNTGRTLVDNGATLIVGHHPQVLRPVEMYARSVIAHSLGNLIADILWLEDFRHGSILHAIIGPEGVISSHAESVYVNDDFMPTPGATRIQQVADCTGLDSLDYAQLTRRMARIQRRSAYRHAIRHIGHYPVSVLASLASATLRRKLGSWIASPPPTENAL
jgi:poly-gamma-glutamate synthesis protein (capsule biosynthesis protein)